PKRRTQPRLRDAGGNAPRVEKEPDQRVERVVQRGITRNVAAPGLVDALATNAGTHRGDGVLGSEEGVMDHARVVGPLQAWQGSKASHRLSESMARLKPSSSPLLRLMSAEFLCLVWPIKKSLN